MMKNRKSSVTIKVNSDLIRSLIEKQGYNISGFSEELGYEKTFLSHALIRGTMSKPSYSLICHKLGQTEDELLAKEPVANEPVNIIDETATIHNFKIDEILTEIKKTNGLLAEILKAWTT